MSAYCAYIGYSLKIGDFARPYLGLPTFRCFSFKPLINGIFAKHMCVGIGHQVVHSVFNRFHWKLWKSAILRAPYLGLRTFQEFSVYTTDSYKPWQTYFWPDRSPSCPINPQYLKPFSIKRSKNWRSCARRSSAHGGRLGNLDQFSESSDDALPWRINENTGNCLH